MFHKSKQFDQGPKMKKLLAIEISEMDTVHPVGASLCFLKDLV